MIKEWLDNWNSFNSQKGLMYLTHYEAILNWMAGKGTLLPPIEASVDPVNQCNLDCKWCNNKVTKERHVLMTKDHLLDLFTYFKYWDVRAICIAGGGEPTLHPYLSEAIYHAKALDIPIAMLTNGTYLGDPAALKASADCMRWVGVSVDCAERKTYKKLKGVDLFDRVITNIKKLVEFGAREVTYKFLLHPDNQHEVYYAIELAKLLGCHKIHIRPVSFLNFQDKEDTYDIARIDDQVEMGRKIFETDRFKIFYVRHKYDENMHRSFGFEKCLATPIMPIFHANGSISLCIDRKNDPSMVFGQHDPIDEIQKSWGSQRHLEVINSVQLKDCPKCTIKHCQQFIEKAVMQDLMDWRFV